MFEINDLNIHYNYRKRITALWAFSESVFGGLLHALKIPFTGLFLGGFAVIFLSLIAELSKDKKDILKVTSIVLAIKFMMSPNTPFTAYLAVFIQGLFAFVIFSIFKNRVISIILLSFFSAIWSASQKIIVTTLIFGMTFWYSIDSFVIYLSKIAGLNLTKDFSMSIILILSYFLLHLIGAIVFARIAIRFPDFLKENRSRLEKIKKEYQIHRVTKLDNNNSLKNSKSKKWYKKPSRIILVVFIVCLSFISYLNPELNKIKFLDVISMLVRAMILIYLWFKVISPLLVKAFIKLFKKNSTLEKMDIYMTLFPEFKDILLYNWKSNASYPKLKRIKKFIEDLFLLLLI